MEMSEKDKALAGMEFLRGSEELKAMRSRAEDLCFQLNQTSPQEEKKRQEILQQLLPNLGEGSSVKPPFLCDYGTFIFAGKDFFANYGCKFLDGGKIIFGDHVLVGPDCIFATPVHPTDPKRRLEGYEQFKDIKVGNNVWFGAGVIVCPGVSIGDNATIGAGSVVTKDIPSNCVAVGNPCRVIRGV